MDKQLGITEYTIGKRLEDRDLEKLETVNKIMQVAQGMGFSSEILTIDITNDKNYILTIDNGKKKVYLGDNTNLNFKLLRLKTVMFENKGEKGVIRLDRDIDKDPVFEREV